MMASAAPASNRRPSKEAVAVAAMIWTWFRPANAARNFFRIELGRLLEEARSLDDSEFLRLVFEYLPISFSRRHGDPSRPWNQFSINVRNRDGSKVLDAFQQGEIDAIRNYCETDVMNTWLYATRLTVAAFSVGRARRCFDMAVDYAAERRQFGHLVAACFRGLLRRGRFVDGDRLLICLRGILRVFVRILRRLRQSLPFSRQRLAARPACQEVFLLVVSVFAHRPGSSDQFLRLRFLRSCGTK